MVNVVPHSHWSLTQQIMRRHLLRCQLLVPTMKKAVLAFQLSLQILIFNKTSFFGPVFHDQESLAQRLQFGMAYLLGMVGVHSGRILLLLSSCCDDNMETRKLPGG